MRFHIHISSMKEAFILICSFLLLQISVNLCSQDLTANLEKYWRYRDRLVNDFMVDTSDVEQMGVNIPMSAFIFSEGFGPFLDGPSVVGATKFGDANNVMGIYLGVLATELWLLKNNEQDYTQTLKELYYLMLAFERLDTYSESYLRAAEDHNMYLDWNIAYWDPATDYQSGDINGFQLRNDGSKDFWDKYKSRFPANAQNLMSSFVNMPNHPLIANSQDNLIHNLEGIALLNSLVGTENVSNIPVTFQYSYIPTYLKTQGIMNSSETEIDFKLWAEDITRRYIDYIQNDNFTIFSSSTISSVLLALLWPLSATKWYLEDPVRNEYVALGSGVDATLAAYFSHGFLGVGEKITGDDDLREFLAYSLLPESSYRNLFITLSIWDYNVHKKLRKLAAFDNAIYHTWEWLKIQRDLATTEGDGEGMAIPLEQLPLECIILYRDEYDRDEFYIIGSNDYNDEIDYYNTLLDSADECGVCSYLNYSWSSTSRLIWPDQLGEFSGFNRIFNGLDYMLLHNLRYIAFHWQELEYVIAEANYGYESVTVPGRVIYSESNIYNADVEFTASKKIILQPGFKVENAHFLANIEPITDGNHTLDYKKLIVSQCDLPEFGAKKSLAINENSDTDMLAEISESFDVQFSIYPNPVSDVLHIINPISSETFDFVSISIFNSVGQKVFEQKLFEWQDDIEIIVDDFSNGIYFLNFEQKDNRNFSKFIKI